MLGRRLQQVLAGRRREQIEEVFKADAWGCGICSSEDALVQVRTKAAAFSTEAGKGTPFTASAAMMEAKIVPGSRPGFPCGVHPAAAVKAAGLCGIFISCGCAAVAGDKINEIFLLLHARNYNPIRSHGMQPVCERCQFFHRPAGFPVRGVRQKAGLRNIGGDDIRQGKKLLHLCAVLRVTVR